MPRLHNVRQGSVVVKLGMIRTLGSAVVAALVISSNAFAQGGDQPQPPPGDQPATPPAPTSDQPPPPATAPADTTPTQPTITLGATPRKDTAQSSSSKKDEKEPETPFFRGSTFYAQTSASTTTFAPQQWQTQSSTVESWFLFQPQIQTNDKKWTLRGRFTMAVEWTDTAETSTTTKNEPVFGDSIFTGTYSLPDIPVAKVKTKAGVVVTLPTSKASIAKTMIFSPGLTVSFARPFEKLGGNEDWSASLGASTTLSRPIYAYTTAGGNVVPYQRNCYAPGGESSSCGDQVSATANTESSLSFLFSASLSWKKFDLSSFFLLGNGWGYTFKDLPGVERLANRVNVRQTTYFNLALDYNITKWISGEVGYYMSRNLIDGNGRIGNPLFDTAQDMRVYLAANVSLDQVYMALAGSSKKSEARAREIQSPTNNIMLR